MCYNCIGGYMKKFLLVFLIFIGLWAILFGVDFILCKNNEKPLIVLKENDYDSIKEYISLGYKVVVYDINNNKTFKIHFLTYKTKNFEIIEPDDCNSVETVFYEDENYEYYFSCNKNVFINMDGKNIEIAQALNNKLVTLNDLDEKGLVYSKRSKVSYVLDIKEASDCNYLLGDKNKLKQISDNIYYYCLDSAYIFVNTDYMELAQAFKKYNFDSIVYGMTKKTSYTDGTIMYNQDNSNILKCSNGKIIIGTKKLENFDFLCN